MAELCDYSRVPDPNSSWRTESQIFSMNRELIPSTFLMESCNPQSCLLIFVLRPRLGVLVLGAPLLASGCQDTLISHPFCGRSCGSGGFDWHRFASLQNCFQSLVKSWLNSTTSLLGSCSQTDSAEPARFLSLSFLFSLLPVASEIPRLPAFLFFLLNAEKISSLNFWNTNSLINYKGHKSGKRYDQGGIPALTWGWESGVGITKTHCIPVCNFSKRWN